MQPPAATTASAAASSVAAAAAGDNDFSSRAELLSSSEQQGQVGSSFLQATHAVNFTSFLKEDGRKPCPYVSLLPSNFPIVCKPIVASAWKKGRFWVVWDGADR